jgi:hypothetical protein
MSDDIIQLPENVKQDDQFDPVIPTPSTERTLGLTLTFTQEGVKIDVRSNLSALEQLGAIEIFKAHLLSSALGTDK